MTSTEISTRIHVNGLHSYCARKFILLNRHIFPVSISLDLIVKSNPYTDILMPNPYICILTPIALYLNPYPILLHLYPYMYTPRSILWRL